MVCPSEVIVGGIKPLLVGTVWQAVQDLELVAIGVESICHIEALGAAIGGDGAVGEGEGLVYSAITIADDHWGAVGIATSM